MDFSSPAQASLFVDLHRWYRGCGLSPACHAKTWWFWKNCYFLKISKWQHKLVREYKPCKLLSYFLKNAVRICSNGQNTSKNFQIKHISQFKAFFISVTFTQVASVSLKVVSATFLLVCFVSLKESTCETWKHASYSTLKAFLVLEIINF